MNQFETKIPGDSPENTEDTESNVEEIKTAFAEEISGGDPNFWEYPIEPEKLGGRVKPGEGDNIAMNRVKIFELLAADYEGELEEGEDPDEKIAERVLARMNGEKAMIEATGDGNWKGQLPTQDQLLEYRKKLREAMEKEGEISPKMAA